MYSFVYICLIKCIGCGMYELCAENTHDCLEKRYNNQGIGWETAYFNNNLCSKLKRNNFKESKLIQIAEALNCVYEGFLLFEIPVKRYKISGTRSWIDAPLFFLCRFTAGIAPEQASL